jgi:uncharacterized protein with PIN domain
MAIVDPFAIPSKGIVDPFKGDQQSKGQPEDSGFSSETRKAFQSGVEHWRGSDTPRGEVGAGEGFWSNPLAGPLQTAGNIFGRAVAPLEMATAPLTGAIHSFGGRGLAGLESLAGEGVNLALRKAGVPEERLQHPDSQQLYEQAKADVDKAMLAAGPGRTGPVTAPWGQLGRGVEADIGAAENARAVQAAPKPPPIPSEVDQVQERLRQAGTPVDVPRALTYQNPALRAGSVALSKAPIVGTPLDEAVRAVPAQMGAGIETLAQAHSPPLPENIVGGGIEQTLSGAAKGEAAAAQAAAEADHAAQVQAWERDNQAREQAITARQAQATNAAARAFGDVAPMEMAQDTIADVQGAARQARAQKDRLYGDVNDLDARVHTSAFSDLRQRAEQALSDAGVNIDDPGSNASNMLRELDRLSGRPGEFPPNVPPRMMQALQREYGDNVPASVLEQAGFPGGTDAVPPDFRMLGRHAPAPGADAVPVQGLEHLNKRIGRMGMQADTPEDRFASKIVKGAFDDWRNDALGSHLTADSEANARPVIDAARAAHRDLMDRFGYNYRRLPEGEPRSAAKTLNQIVTGGIGPEGLRDNLIGAKPGNRRVSSPLYEAIRNAVPNADEFRNRLRGAYWNTMTEGSPAAIARNVEGLTPTRMGSHLFEPHEHGLMRGYAQLSQQTPEQLREAARIAKQNEPKLAKPEPGNAEQLAAKLLGRNRSDEQILSTLDRTMRAGGDIKTFARAWGRMSDANRDEFRGAWLRNMGGGGEQFSVAKFIKNWEDYSPQAKAVMLGREHRQSVQDFYTLAKQYGDTLAKYGNPSGTAQVSAWHNLLKGAGKTAAAVFVGGASLAHPIGVAIAGLGLRGVSKLLATPRGAQQITRWGRIAQSYKSAPSAAKLVALQNTTRLLANSAEH